MKINRLYLAAPWADRKLMDERTLPFEKNDYIITHKWWHYEGADQDSETSEFLRDCAVNDFNGVATSDAIVVFSTAKSEGKAVEQGIALALHKPIIIIGKRGEFSSNVFHHLPQYKWVSSIEDALTVLQAFGE